MKKPGFKRTRRPNHKGHQDCLVCHPDLKNAQKRERRNAKLECKEAVG